jgi:hypothetical protein
VRSVEPTTTASFGEDRADATGAVIDRAPEGLRCLLCDAPLSRNLCRSRLCSARGTFLTRVGSHVRLRDLDAGKTFEYHIVGSAEADPDLRRSNESPVGKAIMGRKKGETVEVTTPRALKFKILGIKAA